MKRILAIAIVLGFFLLFTSIPFAIIQLAHQIFGLGTDFSGKLLQFAITVRQIGSIIETGWETIKEIIREIIKVLFG